MAIQSTQNIAPLYCLEQPDWERGVELERMFRTLVQTSRAGIEQRSSVWGFSRFRISFVLTAMNVAEHQVRRIRAEAECRSPVWVPIWPLRVYCVTVGSGILTVDESIEHDLLPGTMVYCIGVGAIAIGAVSGVTILSQDGWSFDGVSPGDAIYPMRLCRRLQPAPIFQPSHVHGVDEHLTFETL